MKPKDKAIELIKKMQACGGYGFEFEDAKECALVAVNLVGEDSDWQNEWLEVRDEIIKAVENEITTD